MRVHLRFSTGLLDGETSSVVLAGVSPMMLGANSDSLCGVVGKAVLEPRYFRIPLGFSVDFLDGEMFVLCRAMDSFCWCAVEHPVLLVKK